MKDAKEEVVISMEQALAMMGAGEARRHIGSTDMNDASSRSHTIFRMVRLSPVVEVKGCNLVL